MYSALIKLERAFHARNLRRLAKYLEKIAWFICDSDYDQCLANREIFVKFGAPLLMFQILTASTHSDLATALPPSDQTQADVMNIQSYCLSLLKAISFTFPNHDDYLLLTDDDIVELFPLLRNSLTFDPAVILIEEFLAFRDRGVNLSRVPNFFELTASLSEYQLAKFCRVLALCIFESEDLRAFFMDGMPPGDSSFNNHEEQSAAPHSPIPTSSSSSSPSSSYVLSAPLSRLSNIGKDEEEEADNDDNDGGISPHSKAAYLLLNMDRDRNQGLVRPSDYNQSLLVGTPKFLSRIVQIISKPLPPLPIKTDMSETNAAETAGASAPPQQEHFHELLVDTILHSFEDTEPPRSNLDDIVQLINQLDLVDSESSPPPDNGLENGPSAPAPQRMREVRIEIPLGPNVGDDVNFMNDGAAAAAVATILRHKLYTARYSYLTEVIFVLCTLLTGKRKADVQRQLAEMGLVPILSSLFDQLNFDPAHDRLVFQDLRRSGFDEMWNPEGLQSCPNCDCNPECSLKVQCLKLIQNFLSDDYNLTPAQPVIGATDRPAPSLSRFYKRLFFTPAELLSMRVKAQNTPRHMQCSGAHGLVYKIATTLLKQSPDSEYRQLLITCLEAFLRGSDPEDQIFVARLGILDFLVKAIVKEEGHVQIYFDLLSELMKFNPTLFFMFNFASELTFPIFAEVLGNNLVDSNVFLRSVILSLEKFSQDAMQPEKSKKAQYPFHSCKLFGFIEQHKSDLLYKLMSLFTVEEVNQENICCINTALMFMIAADNRSTLPLLIDSLRNYTPQPNQQRPSRFLNAIQNFQNLLWFWHEYYSYRGRFSLALQQSSRISFSRWLEIVERFHSLTSADLVASRRPQ